MNRGWRFHNRQVPQCGKCGKPQALVVQGGLAVDSDRQEVECGTVVFVNCAAGVLPDWVCLTCYPKWHDVNKIACQLDDLQREKEDEICAHHFDEAAQIRDRQDSIRRLLREIVGQLTA